jgi:hypothetical protein
MNSQEIESRYASLKQSRDSGRITDAQFRSEVAQLRFQSSDGAWYQIDPADGRWMKWDGRTWEKTSAQAAAQAPAAQKRASAPQAAQAAQNTAPITKAASSRAPVPQDKPPKKFFPLLWWLVKATLRTFKAQLPAMIFFGILGWVLHTYLLVWINNGFLKTSFIGHFLATQGNSISGTIIWMVASGLLFGWLGQKIFARGRKPPKQAPFSTFIKQAGDLALAAIVASAGIAMVIGIIANGYGNLAMAVGFGGIMLSQGGSVVGLLVSSGWSSTYGLAQGGNTAQFGTATGRVAMLGGILGFLLNTFMPIWAKAIFGVLFLAAAFLLARRQGKQAVTALFVLLFPTFLFAFIIHMLQNAIPVFAHDGGAPESGGTFSGWWNSSGRTTAIMLGTGPAIGTAIGPAIYQTLINIGGNLYYYGNDGQLTQVPPGTIPPGPTTVQTGGTILDENGKPLTEWKPGYQADSTGNTGKPGDVWYGRWMSREEAQGYVDTDIANRQKDEAMFAQQRAKFEADWHAQNAKDRAEGAAQIAAADKVRAQQAALALAQQREQEHMIAVLKKDPNMADEVDSMVADGNLYGIKEAFTDKMQDQINQGVRDSNYYTKVATAWGIAEGGAKVVEIAAIGGLIVVGGPAGAAALGGSVTTGIVGTSVAVAGIEGTEAGVDSYLHGDSAGQILTKTAVGVLNGAKDGAVGCFAQLPGVGVATKVITAAGADTAGTFVTLSVNNPEMSLADRAKVSVTVGTVSGVTHLIGVGTQGMTSVVKREIVDGATQVGAGVVTTVAQGGSVGDGVVNGLEGLVGGKAGGYVAGKASNVARTQAEQEVQKAIDYANAKKKLEIGIEGQSDIVKKMSGDIRVDENGKPYVNPADALDQLKDTASSRTLKQGDQTIQDAVNNTRKEMIYGPADEATINEVRGKLEEAGIIKPGEKLVMDTFSTPGKNQTGPETVGADRDARLVVERTNPETGETMKVEIPRNQWEDTALKKFYEHTTEIAGGEKNITPETQPEYFKRMQDLQNQGYSEDQAKYKAWADTHNQMFTDKTHAEASRDNSDQYKRFIGGEEVQVQDTSNVSLVKQGQTTLTDPHDYARMWQEKSDFYVKMNNPPEAIAQNQKCIQEYMKIRDGYHAQGMDVPPVDAPTAKAMDIISNAPVGVNATPEAMSNINKQLQSLGFKDTNDALGKVAVQNEALGLSRQKVLDVGTGATSSIARDVDRQDYPPPPPPDAGNQ